MLIFKALFAFVAMGIALWQFLWAILPLFFETPDAGTAVRIADPQVLVLPSETIIGTLTTDTYIQIEIASGTCGVLTASSFRALLRFGVAVGVSVSVTVSESGHPFEAEKTVGARRISVIADAVGGIPVVVFLTFAVTRAMLFENAR